MNNVLTVYVFDIDSIVLFHVLSTSSLNTGKGLNLSVLRREGGAQVASENQKREDPFWVDVIVDEGGADGRSSFLVPDILRALECARKFYAHLAGSGEIFWLTSEVNNDGGGKKKQAAFFHLNRGEYDGDAA